MKKLMIFDLDGTLAESKLSLTPLMGNLLQRLLSIVPVAIISGGGWPQFQQQVLSALPKDVRLDRLSLLPTCGTQFYRFTGDWQRLYAEQFSAEERDRIITSLNGAIAAAGYEVKQTWGETIEDRGSQITYSALGQQAPLEEKTKWDADFAKRGAIKAILDTHIPDFSVRLGGTTSIDVTRKGIDKAFGIRKLQEILSLQLQEMIFVGDALFPGGNDYPAEQAGVPCISVRSPDDTALVVQTILACLAE